ncbi:DUF1905 domain-containing protein [Microbacterium sp. zg.Y1090]|uniref:DUF1905 domain-containing protein n=1 Tax=Microbacterium TaxID=33882 RepID=UPI00214CA099|nr:MULTISPECIES: DUF1905 domain-containing protein [unclassified Microbacterium]MCR2814152.1 DUF1905 domain-containing protein [Microbacterium sp. zg.Y1084]MCR2819908.1 DUF1905 domain-containing protein [Microbacterium sp. zg.Y1090]MDL5488020.1 DUF1905 domain-containing protein [Microbacterium sp. zg-Y1211]WIM27496.1 DUF1905 domain-containing protein [Microbacterium sp. zg-Y1090]
MRIEFESVVFRWDARAEVWLFTDIPEELSEQIAELTGPFTRGFGAVRVEATVGATTWRTSIFPSASGRYWLPLKRAVREAEGLDEGGPVTVGLWVLDA